LSYLCIQLSKVSVHNSVYLNFSFFFFFKQKTAYEIGLGIPAEPLFRSPVTTNLLIFIEARINLSRFVVTGCAAKTSATVTFPSLNLISLFAFCFNIWLNEIGRASCRERVEMSGGVVAL